MSRSPFGLSPEEDQVLYYWSKGKSKIDAFKAVMLTQSEQDHLSETAIKKRVTRFFSTCRIREAMEQIDRKGGKPKEEFEAWRERQKENMSRQLDPELARLKDKVKKEIAQELENKINNISSQDGDKQNEVSKESIVEEGERLIDKLISKKRLEEIRKEADTALPDSMSDKQKWLASLQVNAKPSALTIFGTGQFLTYIAVKEMFDRQAAIKSRKIDILSKEGSVLTPNIISAIKTAAAMIIPYAPSPTETDRREMSKAAVLLGLMPDQIQEDPDDYTAPPPVIIDVTNEE